MANGEGAGRDLSEILHGQRVLACCSPEGQAKIGARRQETDFADVRCIHSIVIVDQELGILSRLIVPDQAAADAPVAARARVEAKLSDYFKGRNIRNSDGRSEVLFAGEAQVGETHAKILAVSQLVLGIEIAVRGSQFELRTLSVETQVPVVVRQEHSC